MTVIENIQRQRSISAGQTAPYASAESFGAGYADSLNRIGNSLLDKQKQRDELADMESEAEAKRAVSDSRIELMKRQQELQLNHIGDARGFADRFNNEARKFLEAGRSSLSNAKSAYMFNDAIDGMLTSFFDSNLDFENRELRSQAVAGAEIAINNEVAIARSGGAVDDSIKRAYEHIDFLDKTGASSGDVIKLRNNTRQELMLANLKYTIDKDPSKALSVIGRGTLGLETLPLGELRARLEQVESGGDPKARSQKGAKGLRQIMPNTAREVAGKLGLNEIAGMTDAELEVALENPELNRQLGDFYLNELLQNYDGDQVLATAAYNAGPGNVNNWLKTVGDPRTGKISHQEFIDNIPFGETKRYVGKILGNQTGAGHASFSGLTGGYKDEAERYSEKQYRDWQVKQQGSMLQQHDNNKANALNGIAIDGSSLYSRKQWREIFGEKQGDAYYNEQTTFKIATDKAHDIQSQTPEEIKQTVITLKPTGAEPDASTRWDVFNTVNKIAENEMQLRKTDPASIALRNNQIKALAEDQSIYEDPQKMQSYLSMSLLEQQKLGIKNPKPLTNDQVVSFGMQVNDAMTKKNSSQLLGLFQSLPELYGMHFPEVIAQIQSSGKLPKAVYGFTALTGKNQALDAQALADGIINYDAYKTKVGKEFITMQEAFDEAMQPLYETMDISQRDILRESGMAMALSYSSRLGTEKAAEQAAKAFTEQYAIVGKVRIDTNRYDVSKVTDIITAIRYNLSEYSGKFDVPGLQYIDKEKDSDLFSALSVSINNDMMREAYFVTNEMENGIILVDAYGEHISFQGKPFEIMFDDMISAYNKFLLPETTAEIGPGWHQRREQALKAFMDTLFGGDK
jgi:hypothetical protein